MRITNVPGDTPTLYFVAPDYDEPAGGVKLMYRHVDALNAEGLPAAILHEEAGFRCSWFENETRVTDMASARIRPADLLVLGELDVDRFARQGAPMRHIVLNQSGFLTWHYSPQIVSAHYYSDNRPAAIVTVSSYLLGFLQRAFPRIPVFKVRPGVDDRFRPGVTPPKRITYMPRRGAADVSIALHLLDTSKALAGWSVKRLDGLPYIQVATELQQSQVFVAVGRQEGFGLPPAEAMACGNYVVGYDGIGGREYFHSRFCNPVPVGDVVGLAAALEAAVQAEANEPGWLRRRGLDAAVYMRDHYSPERESADVVATYGAILRNT